MTIWNASEYLGAFFYRRSAPSLDVVYQMRKQLCQLLLEKRKNLLATVELLGGGQLFEAKRPVKHRMGPEVSHGTLDRMSGAVQKLPIPRVHGPLDFIDPAGVFFEEGGGDFT